jgi:TetR/AcrR family transcriptional regulator, regulator of autoinduction and epiphytic fitness
VVDTTPDGRVLRGARNREAMVEALLALYEEGVLRPSVQEVADRAGLSTRSVHNHFADVESMREEVAIEQWSRHAHLTEPPPVDLPLHERIDELVRRRGAFFEAVTPVRRAAMLTVHESPAIRRRLGVLARNLRGQLEVLFAPELHPDDPVQLDAIDVCTSWEAWERLRTQQRLSVAATRRVLAFTLQRLLVASPETKERR